jgi:hypothetical protein
MPCVVLSPIEEVRRSSQADTYDMNLLLRQFLSFIWSIIAPFGQSPSFLWYTPWIQLSSFLSGLDNLTENGHGDGDINFDDLFDNNEYEDGCNPNKRSGRKHINDGYVHGRFWQLQAFCMDPLLRRFFYFVLTIILDTPELEYNRQLLPFI